MTKAIRSVALGLAALTPLLAAPERATAAEGVFDELRVGLLRHDAGVFGNHLESGVDFNGEIRFTSPGALAFLGAPRPAIGLSVNSDGNTDQLYAGLVWTVFPFNGWRPVGEGLFLDAGLGGAVHDGKLDTFDPDRKALGSRVLFHLSLELGWSFDGRNSLGILLDHMSNANLASRNEGLDTLGVRYGYKF
jgi:hypothetical protein